MIIQSLFDTFLDSNKFKVTTLKNYKAKYKAYISKYAYMNAEDITEEFAIDFCRSLNNMHVNSMLEIKGLFGLIVETAINKGVILTNHFRDIKIKKIPPPTRPQPFTCKEINLLLEKADGWFKNYLAFLFYTGARAGEILALEWSNILQDRIIIAKSINYGIIEKTKTYTVREIPIYNALRPYIEEQKKISKGDRIFNKIGGAGAHFYRWRRLCKDCGLENRKLSNSRHTFIKHLLESGVNAEFLCIITGHKNPEMIYKHYVRYLDNTQFNVDFRY